MSKDADGVVGITRSTVPSAWHGHPGTRRRPPAPVSRSPIALWTATAESDHTTAHTAAVAKIGQLGLRLSPFSNSSSTLRIAIRQSKPTSTESTAAGAPTPDAKHDRHVAELESLVAE